MKYDFCDEIRNKFNVDELDSKTLAYRFNGFIYACNMELDDSQWVKEISSTRIPYINKKFKEDGKQYNINFARNYNHEKGANFFILGKYNDLDFLFVNYYDSDRNLNTINEIPFRISIGKVYAGFAYQIEMNTISKNRVKFVIKRTKEKEILPDILTFTANVNDFSKILKLVKSFVYNPELVFVAYNEIMNRKEINFTNKDLNVALVKDEKLDKPMSKAQKILKKLMNND